MKRAHSPKTIIHKKINFDMDNYDLNNNNYINNNNNNYKNDDNDKDNNDIFQNINVNKTNIQEKNNNDLSNIEFQSNALNIIRNKYKNINDNKNKNKNILSKNISNASNDNFSFKVKKNEELYNSKKPLNNIEKENNQFKNESIIESKASSKFNFQINDDIHESEFNDVDFLD